MIMFKKPTKLVYPNAIFHIYNVDLPNDKYPSRAACHLAKNLRSSSHFTKNIYQSRAFDYYNNVLSIFFHLPIYKALNRSLDCFSIYLYRIFRQTIEMFQIHQKYQKSNFLHSNQDLPKYASLNHVFSLQKTILHKIIHFAICRFLCHVVNHYSNFQYTLPHQFLLKFPIHSFCLFQMILSNNLHFTNRICQNHLPFHHANSLNMQSHSPIFQSHTHSYFNPQFLLGKPLSNQSTYVYYFQMFYWYFLMSQFYFTIVLNYFLYLTINLQFLFKIDATSEIFSFLEIHFNNLCIINFPFKILILQLFLPLG